MAIEEQIAEFKVKSIQDGWANELAKEIQLFPMLNVSSVESGDWRYADQYVGGEPFRGFEVIQFKNISVWSMTYRGHYTGKKKYKEFSGFLKSALRKVPKETPVRGPKEYTYKNWKYTNEWSGKLKEFQGNETIYYGEGKSTSYDYTQVYRAEYQGGLIGK